MKLLIFDVEGTIFKTTIRLPGTKLDSTIWQTIAYTLGPEAINEEVITHIKWENNIYNNYFDWMKDTIKIHKKYNLKEDIFSKIINSTEYNKGVIEFFKCFNRSKYIPVLISGGFQNLANRAQIELNISHSFAACHYFFDKYGNLQSYNLLPCDFLGKLHFVNIMLKEYGLSQNDWIFVGDGKNDIEVAKEAPISIGFEPHKDLEKVIDFVIDDLCQLFNII